MMPPFLQQEKLLGYINILYLLHRIINGESRQIKGSIPAIAAE